MAIQIGIEADPHDEGVWKAKISPQELQGLGRPLASTGNRTVLGVVSESWRQGMLFFSPSNVVILNLGASEDALIVGLGEVSSLPAPDEDGSGADFIVTGDDGFRAACTGLFSSEMAGIAGDLLTGLRRLHPGKLVPVQNRKWVNAPANFVAFTIQHRDQSLAVSVRGEPDKHIDSPLNLKRDRPGYSRFKVQGPEDIDRALLVIARAARLYGEGRARTSIARGSASS